MEQWKDIPGYDGMYRVSDQGRIFSISCPDRPNAKDDVLSPDCSSHGYPRVILQKHGVIKRHSVHQLVMLAFVGLPPPNQEINHKDGNVANPRLENLEYVTRQENVVHSYKILGHKSQKGSAHGRSKITEEIATAIREARDAGEKLKSIADRFQVSQGTVSLIASGKIWRHVVPDHRTRPRFRNNS